MITFEVDIGNQSISGNNLSLIFLEKKEADENTEADEKAEAEARNLVQTSDDLYNHVYNYFSE